MLKKRLAEIEARKKEMRSLLEVEGTDLKELDVEAEKLNAEEKELRIKIEMAEKLEPKAEIIIEEKGEKRMEFNVESMEYRNAYLKNLMGQKLTDVEERALTTSNALGVVPTQTMNMIIDKLVQTSVLFSKVAVSYIAGNVSFVVANAKNDAAFKAEGADGNPADDTTTTVSLTGHELIKLVEISAKVQAMSIDAFEQYIVAEIGRKMAIAIENAILNGNGSNAPTGLLHSGQISKEVQYNDALTYADVMKILSSLPTMYHTNACLIMNREMFFNQVAGLVDTQKQPIVIKDVQAPLKYNVLGYPVIIDDYVPEDTALFGDLSYYKLNFAQTPVIESDKSAGFKSGKTIYRGLAVVDGKLALNEAFVKVTKSM